MQNIGKIFQQKSYLILSLQFYTYILEEYYMVILEESQLYAFQYEHYIDSKELQF